MGAQAIKQQAPKQAELDKKFDAVFDATKKSVSAIRYAGFVSAIEGVRSEGTFSALISHLNDYFTGSEKQKIRSQLMKKGYKDVARMIK